MKNILIRTFLAGAAIGAAALIGPATSAAAAESCALGVVCTEAAPVGTGAPAGPPPDQQPPPKPTPEPARAQPAPKADHRSSTDITADLLVMLNQERSSRGLPLFTRHADVDQVAAGWSDHLADEGQLSHNDAYFSAQSRRDHGGRALGENVAMDSEAQPAHEHLMASPHHRDNILDARFTVIGLGATYRDGRWWITEDFLQPAATGGHEMARSMPAAPSKTPAPPTTAVAQSAATPSADVEGITKEAEPEGTHWLATAPGLTSGETSPLSLPTPNGGVPAPATGVAVAGLCCVGGLFLRRRALVFATTS